MVSAARSNYNTSGEYDEGPLRHYHGAASSSSSLSRAAARKSCGDTLPPCCGALCPLWLREVDETNIRLVWLALVQLLYVFAELAAAIVFNSLAMMADAFHNLGDVLAVVTALVGRCLKKRKATARMSFGYWRVEVVCGTLNIMMLLGLCFYLFTSALSMFYKIREQEEIDATWGFIIVAAMGVPTNLLGVLLISSEGDQVEIMHAHSHGAGGKCGGGGHGHGGHGHNTNKHGHGKKSNGCGGHGHGHGHGGSHGSHGHGSHGHGSHGHGHEDEKGKEEGGGCGDHHHHHDHDDGDKREEGNKAAKAARRDLNMHSVVLHFLYDVGFSIAVTAMALVIHYFNRPEDKSWVDYLDPSVTMLFVFITAFGVWPVLSQLTHILLEGCPDAVDAAALQADIESIDGVGSVVEMHVIQIDAQQKYFSTVKVVRSGGEKGVPRRSVFSAIKNLFRRHGVNCTVVELLDPEEDDDVGGGK